MTESLRVLLPALVGTALVGLVLQRPNVWAMTRLAVLDEPTHRSLHETPTPRGGGLAVVAAGMLGLLLVNAPAGPALALGLFALIGLIEDLRGIRPLFRLGLQLAAGAVVGGTLLWNSGLAGPEWLALPLMVLWLTGFVNVFNFMDGINGISSLHAVVSGIAIAGVGLWLGSFSVVGGGLVLAVAAANFLPWNAVRPRIFLGDVGSYGLGAVLGTLAMYALIEGAPAEAVLAPLAVYLTDTTWTLLSRIRAKQDWLSPHRSHVYQRLTLLGWSHLRVASLTALLSVAVSALGAASLLGSTFLRVFSDGVAITLLVGYLAAPQLLTRWRLLSAIRTGTAL